MFGLVGLVGMVGMVGRVSMILTIKIQIRVRIVWVLVSLVSQLWQSGVHCWRAWNTWHGWNGWHGCWWYWWSTTHKQAANKRHFSLAGLAVHQIVKKCQTTIDCWNVKVCCKEPAHDSNASSLVAAIGSDMACKLDKRFSYAVQHCVWLFIHTYIPDHLSGLSAICKQLRPCFA